ncbi:MAG TPA: tetratricopeptide repeat protein [Gemmatimonadales bacterium]|nr:tetratricopeptide repeat protein [Gemmatimonadales bacterium]
MNKTFTRHVWLTVCGMVSIIVACDRTRSENGRETGAISTEDTGNASAGKVSKAKIPVTTKSNVAKTLYNKGLEYADQLRFVEAREKFQQAVVEDSEFAMAHYYLALNSPTTKAFRTHVDKAASLADKASEGERLLILALEANANADPAKSLEYAKQAAAKYPQDERAQLTLAFGYGGEQNFEKAIEALKKSIEINPKFSPAYNSLGYAYRPLGNYAEAEKAFKQYIQLVPNDPNPYDSYAELLMKTGRFDESITQYRKALSIDPHFTASNFGIASNLIFQNRHDEAIAESRKLDKTARDDAARRLAMFTRTLAYVDQGETDAALKEMQNQYDLGAKIGDTAAMAADAVSMGDILLEAGTPDAALKRYEQALNLRLKSGLPDEVKEDAKLAHHYNGGRVALKKNDVARAKVEAKAYLDGAAAKNNDTRIRQAHALAGMIALREKKYDEAISELGQADQQDPYVIYLVALAQQGKGDQTRARQTFKRAAEMYLLPTLNYALIRAKAKAQSAPQSTS